MAKKQPKLTEFTPEPNAVEATPKQLALNEFQQKLKMYAASLDREISRIKTENAVRLGDSVICEASCCDAIVTALQEVKKNYV